MTRSKTGRVLWTALAVGVLFAVLAPGAVAQTPTEITIGANAGGNDNVHIECTWVLMDMDDGTAGMQYRVGNSTDDNEPRRNDAVFPDRHPCDFHANDGWDGPTYDAARIDDARVPNFGVIQVSANNGDGHVNDLAGAQLIEIWTAVDVLDPDPNARETAVTHDVFHPDGTPKFQLYAVEVPCGTANDLAALGYDANTQSILSGDWMFNAASYAGGAGTLQIAPDAVTNQGGDIDGDLEDDKGIAKQCLQGVKELYKSDFKLSKHQPHGLYRVRTVATDRTDTEILDQVEFYVERSINMQVDFLDVVFPTTAPGGVAIVQGDVVWDKGNPANNPTVYNDGLSGMNLEVEFTRLCGGDPADGVLPGVCPEQNPLAKEVTDFDVSFGLDSGHLSHFRPEDGTGVKALGETPGGNFPNASADFGNGDYQTLCANETGKIDFSAHLASANGLREGMVLSGQVILTASLDDGTDLADEGGPWGANFASVNQHDPTEKTCNNDNWFWGGWTGVDYDGSPANYDLDGNGSFDEGLYGQPNGNDQTGNPWDAGLPIYAPTNYGNQRTMPPVL